MAGDDTGNTARNELLAAMGPELGGVFHALYDDLVWLHMRWALYRQLFAGSSARIDLLNETAGTFFYVVQNTLWEDVLLGLAKLADPPKSSGKGNLSLQSLPRLVQDQVFRGKIEVLLHAALASCKSARDWRNRRIAHCDLQVALATNVDPLPGVSHADIEGALLACRELMNSLDLHFRDVTVGYEHSITGPRDADSLVYYLNRGLRAEREAERRMLSGDIRPEDFAPGEEV